MSNNRRTKAEVQMLVDNIIELTDAGATPPQIASELDVSVPYVYQILAKEALPAAHRPRTEYPEPVEQAVVDAYVSGVNMRRVLTEHGLSYTQMYTILNRHNVDVRGVIERRRQATGDKIEKACQMYADGVRLSKIMADTGIDNQTLRVALAIRGIPNRRDISEKVVEKIDGKWYDVIDPSPL